MHDRRNILERCFRDAQFISDRKIKMNLEFDKNIDAIKSMAEDRAYDLQPWPLYFESKAREFKTIAHFYNLTNAGSVLEIGCGNGEFSRRFLNNGAEMYCVDISPTLIGILKERYAGTNLRFDTADIECLPYADGYFDGVIGNGILHHLNLDICLDEIHRVLKSGGRIFFSEPNMLNPEVFLETNIRFFGKLSQKTPEETAFFRWILKRKLLKTGFKNVSLAPFDFLQPLVPAPFIGTALKIGAFLEKVPILKEIAGSLKITAEKL